MTEETVKRDPRVEKAVDTEMKRRINTFIGHVSGGKEGPRYFPSVSKLRQLTGAAEVISRGPE